MNSKEKQHKEMCKKILKSVSFWIETSKFDYKIEDLATVLNEAKTPPFTIENKTDGGEELRMKYRYLDIRRNKIKENLILRHKISSEAETT